MHFLKSPLKIIHRVHRTLFSVTAAFSFSVLGYCAMMQSSLPDRFTVAPGEKLEFSNLPITASAVETLGDGDVAQVYKNAGNSYTMQLKLPFGIALKQVKVDVAARKTVVPSGMPFGIKMFTDGVMVVSMGEVKTESGNKNPAHDAGIEVGDIILSADSKEVDGNDEFSEIISGCDGKAVTLKIQRREKIMEKQILPVKGDDGVYRAGVWVRDSSAGIGTVSFYDPDTKVFGGLGHAVCDIDTGEILPLLSGEMADVKITGCTKGESGDPGELCGSFEPDGKIGELKINSQTGIFGILDTFPDIHENAIPVAMRQEVKEGKAQILSTVNGKYPKKYDIIIEKVDYSVNTPTKNLQIKITDEELLKTTGGIVQGMSGSPIIQNGRFVGAVTHVFIQDPQRGYGIFAENMLETAKNIEVNK